MSQTLVSENNSHPYIIGNDYRYVIESSKRFRLEAEDDGYIIY